MSKGSIRRRGKSSWEVKYELPPDPETGQRRTRFETVRGKRSDADARLRAILTRQDKGLAIEPSRSTVAEYLEAWLTDVVPLDVQPKALERYRGLVKNQINPHLGEIILQRLRPADVAKWHQDLVNAGKLSTRTIRHAHSLLSGALRRAAAVELVERNVAALIKPPAKKKGPVASLTKSQAADVLRRMEGHSLYTIVVLALATGARRGELAALRWSDVDLDRATLRIERALEQTKAGLRVKPPKTEAGLRTITLPASAVKVLRAHRGQQRELWLAAGLGALPAEQPMFGDVTGAWPNPYSWSDRWRDAVKSRRLPKVTFHGLRHTHASALIAAKLDLASIANRLGHESPAITLSTYAHAFKELQKDNGSDDEAAKAIEAALTLFFDPVAIRWQFRGSEGLKLRRVAGFLASPTGFEPVLPT